MHLSIVGILQFNLFGIPQVGADICGFYLDTTFELCLRWTQLGAFYPLSRNHNALGQMGAKSVDVYFPEAPWFDYYTGEKVSASLHNKYVSINAPLEKIPLFIRGGNILPTQAPAARTAKSQLNPFGLIVALDEQGEASVSLFWDDGESIDTVENGDYFLTNYTYREGHLKSRVVNNNYRGVDSLRYDTFQILGVTSRPNAVILNGKNIHNNIQYQENGKLTINIFAPLGEELDIMLQ